MFPDHIILIRFKSLITTFFKYEILEITFYANMDVILAYANDLSLIELTLCAVLLFFFIILILYSLILWRKPYSYQKKVVDNEVDEGQLPGISVVITTKNDSAELKRNLPYIMDQDYPSFEVIVVNSGSSDDTDIVLTAADQEYSKLYHTFIPSGADDINEKKLAVTVGVKAAKYDIIMFTESYSRPVSKNWIREYGKEFLKGKDILLGYSRIVFPKKVLMRKFISYDNLIHHLKFLSMAIYRKPYMGIGRNMAYRKELFFNNKGFSSILGIEAGEDDLYVNKISNKKNTGVILSHDSITETDSVDSFSTWRSIKSKYLYTKQFYKGPANFIFGFETFSKYGFALTVLMTILVSVFYSNFILLGFAIILFLLRFAVQLFAINKNSSHFDYKKYNIDLLYYEFVQPISNFKFRKYADNRNRYR